MFQSQSAAEKWLNEDLGGNVAADGYESDNYTVFQAALVRGGRVPPRDEPRQNQTVHQGTQVNVNTGQSSSHHGTQVNVNTNSTKKTISLESAEFMTAETAGHDTSLGIKENIFTAFLMTILMFLMLPVVHLRWLIVNAETL